jgi:hypothetical protein
MPMRVYGLATGGGITLTGIQPPEERAGEEG